MKYRNPNEMKIRSSSRIVVPENQTKIVGMCRNFGEISFCHGNLVKVGNLIKMSEK